MTAMILSLFDPNTLLPHRAGVAGLALALSDLSPGDVSLSWEVTEDQVRLSWDSSDREAIEWLVRNTYQIEDGYLNVPALNLDEQGRYTFTQGVTSTLLQHSQQRQLASSSQPKTFSVDEGQPEIAIDYRPLESCYYTRDLKDPFTSKGQFKSEISLKGHHLPGLVECFANGPYKETPAGFIALLFLPLACGFYKLPGPGLRSALVIPEVVNLKHWIKRRKGFSGRTYKQFRASGAGESGLRFLIAERAIEDAKTTKVDYCEVYQLGAQSWDTNQTYLKQAIFRVRATDEILELYQNAQGIFPAWVRTTKDGKPWLALSKVLPWIADNLIANKRWYESFFEFRKANELYERKGLVTMTQYLNEEEQTLFEAVRGAFSTFLRGQILQAQNQGRKLDYAQVTDKALYRLQRPSTKQEFATALVSFLSQYRSKAAKGNGMQIYGWVHSDQNWRKARDLAMLAIATYQKRVESEAEIPDGTESEAEQDSEDFEFATA